MSACPWDWNARLARADALARVYPFATEVLLFYKEVAAFQQALHSRLPVSRDNAGAPAFGPVPLSPVAQGIAGEPLPVPQPPVGQGIAGTPMQIPRFPVAQGIAGTPAQVPPSSVAQGFSPADLDVPFLLSHFPALLGLVSRVGPIALAERAGRLAEEGEDRWAVLLAAFWEPGDDAQADAGEMDRFFARALLQPYAERLAESLPIHPAAQTHSICPCCGGKPVVGVLRPEGYGAKRSLVCSLCSTEWDYRRLVCPACGEDRFDDLVVYTASAFEHVRVDACETCKTYIKTVDLTKDGLAVPAVDELATIPLTLWAEAQGYRKLEPNLLGM